MFGYILAAVCNLIGFLTGCYFTTPYVPITISVICVVVNLFISYLYNAARSPIAWKVWTANVSSNLLMWMAFYNTAGATWAGDFIRHYVLRIH